MYSIFLRDRHVFIIPYCNADPVIYYSSTVTDVSSETDTLDSSEWSTEKPDDMSKVTAIAIDARKKMDGSDFVMKPNTAVSVYLYMKAPDMDNSGSSDPAAYNNIYLYNTIQTRTSDPYTDMLHEKYTQARLRVMGNVPIIKVKAGDHSQTIGGIQFNLSGTSDYGTEVDVTQTTPSTGKLIFRDIEKGDYSLQEVKTTDDWLANTNQYKLHIDESGKVTITGLTAEDGYYPIENTPRIHGDLSIVKTDSVNTSKTLSGAEFKLSGTSYYGTSVLIYGQTDEGGKLTFDNIEKGTYTLTETAATDGYILNRFDNTWTAVCDSNGNFTVYKDNKPVEQSGNYEEITNEPLHEFTILKTPSVRFSANDPTALAGATFELTGTSDYGTAIDMTETTGDSGTLTFKGLEPGVYTLKETAAPNGYHTREDKWAVVIKADDTVSIDGLSQDGTGNWIITDQKKADGKVVITKHWNDGLTGKAAQNRPYPNIIIESYNKDEKINIPVKVLFVGKSDSANVTATLKRNGETVNTATISSDTKQTVFTNQPKSDENGLEYEYTVEASISGNYETPTVTGDVSGFTISLKSYLEMNIETAETVMEKATEAYKAYKEEHGSVPANIRSPYKTATYTYFANADGGIINFHYPTDSRWIVDSHSQASTNIDPSQWTNSTVLSDTTALNNRYGRIWTVHMDTATGKIKYIYVAFPTADSPQYLEVVNAIKAGNTTKYEQK